MKITHGDSMEDTTQNSPKVRFSEENVYIYPSSNQGIAGRIFLIERDNRQITLAWTPYYMFQQAKNDGATNPTDLYAIQVPLQEIRYIKRYTPALKVHHLIVVSESGVAFPPYYFQGGGMKEFMYALKAHVNLVKSEDDPNTFYLVDLDEPMSLLRSSLDTRLASMQEASKLEIDQLSTSIIAPSSFPTSSAPMINVNSAPMDTTSEDTQTKIQGKMEDIKEDIIKASEELSGKAEEMKKQVEEKVEDLKAQAGEKLENIMSQAEEMKAQAGEKVEGLKAQVGEKVGEAKEEIGKIQREVKQAVKPQSQPMGSPKSPNEKHWSLLQNFSKVTQFARNAVRGDLRQNIDNQVTALEEKLFKSPPKHHGKPRSAPEAPHVHHPYATKIGSFELVDDEKIKMSLPQVVRTKEVSPDEWMGFFDDEGRINDEAGLERRIFYGGVDPSIRVEVWKYLLGLYPLQSTYEEREKILTQKRSQYEQYKSMWKGIQNDDLCHWNKFKSRCHNIDKDVVRTDRTMEYYEGDGNPNLRALNDILSTYIFLNMDLGYVQGMNELLSPILFVMNNEADAFWCFHYLMESPKHGFMCNFDRDQNGMRVQLNQLTKLISVIDPGLHEYLKEKDCLNMFFCFRWILIHFKREFSFYTIQRLWEVMWTNHLTNLHLFIAAAILIKHRQYIISRNMAFDDIIKYTNDLANKLNLDEVLKEAEEAYNLFMRTSPSDVMQEIQTLPSKKPAAI